MSGGRRARRLRLRIGAVVSALALVAGLASAGAVPAFAAPYAGPHVLNTRAQTATHVASAPRDVITGAVVNHGGPAQSAPRVYVDFWGWLTDPSGERAYLQNFLNSVGGTPWLADVIQYGGGNTANLLAGVWSDPAAAPPSPSDAQIQQEAVAAANHFGIAATPNVQIMVATPTGHSTPGFNTPGGFCAYHGAVQLGSGVTLPYVNLPYITDAGAACGQFQSHPAGPLDGVSIVAGHELAEAITDPLLNGWYQDDAAHDEIGDKCAWTGLADINTALGAFAVQPLWSITANNCVMSTTIVPRTDIAGVGSDVAQYLVNQFAAGYNATGPAQPIVTYDTTGPSPIQTKGTITSDPQCNMFRPSNSNAGITALAAHWVTGDGANRCVDFSGSSRAPRTDDPPNLAFAAYAMDAITWAATAPSSGGHAPSGASFTLAQLANIYACNNPSSHSFYQWRWSDFFPGASSDPIVPVLPAPTSVVGAFFLAAIGVVYPGSCVVISGSEDQGTAPVFYQADGVTPNPDVITPYSIGAYISQADTHAVTQQQPGALTVQNLTGTNGVRIAPIVATGSGVGVAINRTLPSQVMRVLYNVLPNAGTPSSPAIPAYLASIFGPSGWICTSPAGRADIPYYGFLPLGIGCGSLTATG